MDYSYAYLVLDCFLGLTWLAFFLIRKDLRRQQLLMSALTAPLSLTQVWFYIDYFRPDYISPVSIAGKPYGIEDLLFAFFIGGIASVLYEVVWRKKFRATKKRFSASLALVVLAFVIFALLHAWGLNTAWAASIPLIGVSFIVVYLDQDVFMDWLMSGVLMFVFIVSVYAVWLFMYPDLFPRFWRLENLSGAAFFDIPIEELTWFVSWAMFSGVIYEFFVNAGPYMHLKLRSTRANI